MRRAGGDENRNAILEAANRIMVTPGLSAPTAEIAKEASAANASLFTYFEAKADLFNRLYLKLKGAMAATALKGLPVIAEFREQLFYVW